MARGNEQRPGLNYDETFAPVVKWSTVGLVVASASAFGWPISQMDVVTAFLNGTLKELIFMDQPAGFEVAGKEHLVCRLKRSIYGQKQSPRTWCDEVDSFFRQIGCTSSLLDPNQYIFRKGKDIAIIIMFVDDLLITGSSTKLINSIKDQLCSKYDMKDLGTARRYLGVDLLVTDTGILMHQADCCHGLIKDNSMENCRPVKTPLPEELTLSAETGTAEFDFTTYCRLVGKLIYLTNPRPDLSFAVVVSRFMAHPWQAHWDAAVHILRYIKGTVDLGISFQRCPELELKGFTDSD